MKNDTMQTFINYFKGFTYEQGKGLSLEEIDKRGLHPIWACDVENTGSMRLAEKLGFINPVKYNFIFFTQVNEKTPITKRSAI